MANENYINHIALVLDASSSMRSLADDVVKVADEQIRHLARLSQDMNQETRVSVYAFADDVKCLVFDKDVLRLPSIRSLYKVYGNTALIDATMQSIGDLQKTAQMYGDHSFLVYVLTDGAENASRKFSFVQLRSELKKLPDNWTMACFVPSKLGQRNAINHGFSTKNTSIWSTDEQGLKDVGSVLRRTTDQYYTLRSQGIKGTRRLFNLDVTDLMQKLKSLDKLHFGQYRVLPVQQETAIAPFIENTLNRPYKLGEAFYQLTKPEKVQAGKQVIIRKRKTHEVFTGGGVRQVLGLPDYEVKVDPVSTPEYDIFVQSTSVNRKLMPGTDVVVL